MIWLTWRQFRLQAWVVSAFLAVMAVILAISGTRLAHLYDTSGLAACHAHADCATLSASFLQELKSSPVYSVLYYLGVALMYLLPAVIGVFWGAPLVTREIETGTLRLAWNQSVSRTRWLAAKLGLIGLSAIAAAGLLSLMVTWWAEPVQRAAPLLNAREAVSIVNRFAPVLFGTRGIVPAGYAAFAFALGVTAGVLIRRTVPAMAATLGVFAAVQAAFPEWIRPHLLTPLTLRTSLDPAAITMLAEHGPDSMTVVASVNLPGAWVLGNQTFTPSGQISFPVPQACHGQSFKACQAAVGRLHLRQVVTYQPASRYWEFQWIEAGIFAALALALAGFCFWWVRQRRLT